MIVGQLTDFMIIVLILAAVIEGITGEIRSPIVLLTVVVINVVIGFHQERKATLALEALVTLTVPQVLESVRSLLAPFPNMRLVVAVAIAGLCDSRRIPAYRRGVAARPW